MRQWVSCEDKLDLLDRMYGIAHSHLGRRDQAVYVSMRQEFLQRIEAVKAVRGRGAVPEEHVGIAADEEPSTEPEEFEIRAPESAELSPEDVVRLFVSCWDCRDFVTEFSLLSPSFLRAEGAPTDLRQYVKHRKAKYSARLLKGQIGKRLENICRCEVSGSRAMIDCVETRMWHTSTAAQRRRYHLRNYAEGWLIDYFENVLK